MKTDRLFIRISPEDKKMIQELAEKRGLTVSEYVIRLAVEDGARRYVKNEGSN